LTSPTRPTGKPVKVVCFKSPQGCQKWGLKFQFFGAFSFPNENRKNITDMRAKCIFVDLAAKQRRTARLVMKIFSKKNVKNPKKMGPNKIKGHKVAWRKR